MKIAVVGGTGLCDWPGMQWLDKQAVQTRFGEPSAELHTGVLNGVEFVFLPRHGGAHSIAPHRINYRANIAALHQLGVTHILAVNAVGGLTETLGPGALAVPEQIVDYSWGRECSFADGEAGPLDHVDFTEPYSAHLRQQLLSSAAALGYWCFAGGVYACTQGPRLETAAEIRRLQADGCHLVGMTAMPEAVLARELGIDYASLCLVVNWGAGMTREPITMDDIARVLNGGMSRVCHLLGHTIGALVRAVGSPA